MLKIPFLDFKFFKDKALNISIIDQSIVSFSNFILNISLARMLGLETYGLFVLIWAAIQFIITIQTSLIISPSQSFLPKIILKDEKRKFIGQANFFYFLLLSLLALIFFLLLFFVEKYNLLGEINKNILFLYFILFISQDYIRKFYFIIGKIKIILFADILLYLIIFSYLFIFQKNQLDLNEVYTFFNYSFFIAIIIYFFSFPYKLFLFQNLKKYLQKLWNFSQWLMYSLFFNWFNSNYVFFITAILIGNKEVGAIRAAQNIIGISHVLFQVIENTLPIKLSLILRDFGKIELKSYLKSTYFYFISFVTVLGLFLFIFSDYIIILIYKDFDSNIKLALLYFIPIYIILAISSCLRSALKALENTKVIFWGNLVGALIIIVLSKFLIEQYQIQGSMICFLLIQLIMMILLMLSYNKLIKQSK
jgi:O-antigen/teichoic acid export membrane protein